MKRLGLLAAQVMVGIVFILVWHVFSTQTFGQPKPILDPFFFSTPVKVLERTWRDLAGGELWRHIGITLTETALAFVIGAAFGILFGFAFARLSFWRRSSIPTSRP